MLKNQLDQDMLPMKLPKPAVDRLSHQPNHPKLEPSADNQLLSAKLPTQLVELPHTPAKLAETHMDPQLHMSLQLTQPVELNTTLNQLKQLQAVLLTLLLLKLTAQVKLPHTLYHLHQLHMLTHQEFTTPLHSSQPAQVLRQSILNKSQLTQDMKLTFQLLLAEVPVHHMFPTQRLEPTLVTQLLLELRLTQMVQLNKFLPTPPPPHMVPKLLTTRLLTQAVYHHHQLFTPPEPQAEESQPSPQELTQLAHTPVSLPYHQLHHHMFHPHSLSQPQMDQ